MLSSIFLKASTGLATTSRLLDTTSRNINSASQEGYTRKIQSSITVDSQNNVWAGPIRRAMDAQLSASLRQSQSAMSFVNGKLDALERLNRLSNDPVADSNLAAKVDQLGSMFQLLESHPADGLTLRNVVEAAEDVATTIRSTYGELSSVSDKALGLIKEDVGTLNTLTARFSELNRSIVGAHAAGADTTDFEDERDRVLTQISEIIQVQTFEDGKGAYHLYTADNKLLADMNAKSVSVVEAPPPAVTGAIQLGSERIYTPGGRIGANQWIRDSFVPERQAQLDAIAAHVTSQFNSIAVTDPNAPPPPATTRTLQLELFRDDRGATPFAAAATPGYASRIGVNEMVVADPRYLRTGTSWTDDLGGTGTPDPNTTDPTDTTVISKGRNLFLERAAFADPTMGTKAMTLAEAASMFTATVASELTATQSEQSRLDGQGKLIANRLADKTEVKLDDEMARLIMLQNSYAASARVITTTQTMFDQLFAMVR